MRRLVCALLVACSSQPVGGDAGPDVISEAGAPTANGTVGPWQTLADLPSPRANFCATVVGAYVVAIGGNFPDDAGSFTKLDEVAVARFHADGSLDAWSIAGHTPSPVTECTAAGSGSTLYLLDGIYDDTTKEGHAFTATLGSDGTLGPFMDTGPLPNGDDLFDDLAFATADRIVAVTSKLSGSCALLGAPLAGLTPWTDQDWLPEFRGRPEWANATTSSGSYVYALGGYSDADAGNVALATGYGVASNDGAPATAFSVTPLPTATTFGTAASADDYVFVLGGRSSVFGAPARADVLSAQAHADGSLSAWSSEPSLPAPRSNVSAVVAGSYLYVLGGADTGTTATVYAAQVRF